LVLPERQQRSRAAPAAPRMARRWAGVLSVREVRGDTWVRGCFGGFQCCSCAAGLRDRSARSGGCLSDCPGGPAFLRQVREAFPFAADGARVTRSPGSRRRRGGRRSGGGLAMV